MAAYIEGNPKNKKTVKDWIKEGKIVRIFSNSMYPVKTDGREVVEGPHSPKPHTFYGTVTLVNGVVTKIE